MEQLRFQLGIPPDRPVCSKIYDCVAGRVGSMSGRLKFRGLASIFHVALLKNSKLADSACKTVFRKRYFSSVIHDAVFAHLFNIVSRACTRLVRCMCLPVTPKISIAYLYS